MVTLVSNEIVADSLPTFGLQVRLVRFFSNHYAVGELDAALRRNVGIWTSAASHVVTFDDDQLAPPNLVSSIDSVFKEKPFFWGHHRFIDFRAYTLNQILSLPPEAGRARETPANAWHSWRSAYAGLFGCRRELVLEIGGFDMKFSGRHGGEDQNLGRRVAERYDRSDIIFVHEPPFAWHPELSTSWDRTNCSNQCTVTHDLRPGRVDNVPAQVCQRCPFYWVQDSEILEPNSTISFNPVMVQVTEEHVGPTIPRSLFVKLLSEMQGLSTAEAQKFLRPAYDEYVSTVSSPDMAVSLATSAFLHELCERLAPASILDLGSGFSSYSLRSYAAKRKDVRVFTVDDDPAWLARTRHFLGQKGLCTDDLLTWDDFELHPPSPVDFVFHDLGSMATRSRTLPSALNHCRMGGIVVFDDMHKEEYAPGAEQVLLGGGFRTIDAREHTLDRFGRFCWVAAKAL